MADTLLYEKQSLTKGVKKGTEELADTLFLRRNPQQRMLRKVLTNWKISYCLKYLKNKDEKVTDELADTFLSEKKSSTKKVEKGTDELANTLLS